MEDSDDDDVEESIEQLHQTLQNEVNDDALTIENAVDAILVSPNQAFKKVQNVTMSLPLYKFTLTTTKSKERSQFLQIDYKGQPMYIRKSSAVWLFSEGERLSSDRLIRERDSQPFNVLTTEHVQDDDLHVAETISTGDMCVLAINEDLKIGRVLQFAYLTEKQKKIRQCKDKTVAIKCNNEIGVLCTWFVKVPQLERVFTLHIFLCHTRNIYMYTWTIIVNVNRNRKTKYKWNLRIN